MPLSDYDETDETVPQGGYAVVRFAVNRLSDKRVAIKRPRTDQFAPKDTVLRFIRETKQLVSLSRDSEIGFVRVIEANDDPDRDALYMVMERCAGDLAGLQPGPHEPARCALWFALVCDALAAMHNRRLSHRDLKPGNLLVRNDGNLCIADLGSCLPFEDIPRMSAQGESFPGTPEYMAPETIGHHTLPEEVFYPADVYAVGVILYELLGGRPPFVREDFAGGVKKLEEVIPSQLPPLLRSRRPDVPRQLEDIIHQCLEKQPSLRPTAWDLARHLRQFAGFHSNVFPCFEDESLFEKEKRRNLIACIPEGNNGFRLRLFDPKGDLAVEVDDSQAARYGQKAELLRLQICAWSPSRALSGYEKQLLTVAALAVIDPGVIAGLLLARAPSQGAFSPVYGDRTVRFREYVELPIAVLLGGDGTTTFRSGRDGTDDEITCEPETEVLRLRPDILEATDDYIQHKAAEAKGRYRFENKLQIRIDSIARDKESDVDGQLKPLKLYTSLTQYFDTHRTHFCIDSRLADGRSIRTKYAGDYKSFERSYLANPICVNLSIVTADRYIVFVERGRLTAGNPRGHAPAVSGTADYYRDKKGEIKTYDPWAHAIREAQEEIFGEYHPPTRDQIVFYGLAKRTDNFCPFLFGEARTDLSKEELARQTPLQDDEVERLIFVDFSRYQPVVDAIEKLWRMEEFSPTAIYSLYVSLLYHFRSDKREIDKLIHRFTRRSIGQLEQRFSDEAVRRIHDP